MKTITRKSMLYQTGVEYGDWAMNHVEGCSHGCKYPCYAYLQKKRFGVVSSYEDWCEPKLVSNTLELLEKELTPARVEKIKNVQLCFTTDPFMTGYPEVCDMSLDAIKTINREGIPVTVLTKGVLPTFRELAPMFKVGAGKSGILAAQIIAGDQEAKEALLELLPHPGNYYGISLVSLDENFREKWEPGSAPFADRIASLKALHDAGCKTWVSMEPCPHPGIIVQDYYALLDSISFVDRIVYGRWNYNASVNKSDNPRLDWLYVEEINSFYGGMAQYAQWFCKEHGIECIIKEGTVG